MCKTVTSDPAPRAGFEVLGRSGVVPVAIIGQELNCWTNSHGAVAAVLPGGDFLGLKAGEFEVLTWLDLE